MLFILAVNNLDSGTYVVAVQNLTTFCVSSDTFALGITVGPIELIANSTPRTNCVVDNGSVSAAVSNGGAYTYEWYIGTTPGATPDFTGTPLDSVQTGSYTVVATDVNDAACVSDPVTVTVVTDTIPPVVDVMQKAPVTNCDPTKPNGVAVASVNGGFIGYTFDWYDTVGDSLFATGPEVSGLAVETPYRVEATDIFTQCTDDEVIESIEFNPEEVPVPITEVLSHQTRCDKDIVGPNGALRAYVLEDNGVQNIQDYIFTWYLGDEVTTDTLVTGNIIDSLDAGIYTVLAESRITGCINTRTDTILELLDIPNFTTTTGPATCEGDNGFAQVTFIESSTNIESIIWIGPLEDGIQADTVVGSNLFDVEAGTYEVTVTNVLGCSAAETVVVSATVEVFNGVSANGDGINDFLEIGCIENYPNNSVKIYNRSGTLVFEKKGYNNDEFGEVFTGTSNKGISMMGDNLPDGTYFMIIDLGDGSKPIASYLELID